MNPRKRDFLQAYVPFLLAGTVAAILSLPGVRFAYVFDDYDFLGRAQQFRWSHLVPNASDMFYRPVSRELYFGLLEWLSPGDPRLGHVLNIGLVFASIILVGRLVTRLSGPRAGLIASLVVGAFGQWPILVAWVCGSQDLLAIVLLLAALNSELRAARSEAIFLFALAALSKETALAAAPALVAAAWIRTGTGSAARGMALQLSALVSIWVLLHPGIRTLLVSGGVGSQGSYVGIDNPTRWKALAESIPVLFNAAFTGRATPWPTELTGVLLLSFVPMGLALWQIGRTQADESIADARAHGGGAAHCLLIGTLLCVPTLLLTCLLVKHWAPYYACFPALGLAVVFAPRLATLPFRVLGVGLIVFLVGGVWSRGAEFESGLPAERSLATAGMSLRTLEQNFKRVAPQLEAGSTIYVSTMATGAQSIYIHLHRFQALRVWYRDPSIQTLRPEKLVTSSRPEYLFWVDPALEVFQVDPRSLSVRSSGKPVEAFRYRSTLRSFAVGLAGAGQLQRAVDVLLGIDGPETWHHAISYRTAAMLVYAYGFEADGDQMLAGIPTIPRESAFEAVQNLLTMPMNPTRPLERHALRAFGFSWDDVSVIRRLMLNLDEVGYRDVSGRLAGRVLTLDPGDADAIRLVSAATHARVETNRITPGVQEFERPGSR